MKLTKKGKEVWNYQTTQGQVPKVDPGQWAFAAPGIPFGWTVAREAMNGSICDEEALPSDHADYAVICSIELCNKLAEVES